MRAHESTISVPPITKEGVSPAAMRERASETFSVWVAEGAEWKGSEKEDSG